MTRVDLHLHSRFSRRSEEWIFRKVGVAKSYSEPRALYEKLRAEGFGFFTLTDHHTLEGCLELQGLPGVFFSEQVTSLFPEDRVPVELLILGLTPEQHGDIEALRGNIYELQQYLAGQRLVHAVAHPFFSPENRLQTVHIEKLLLLFKHFEVRNGMRASLVNDFSEGFLRALTPRAVECISDRLEIEPTHERPWEKFLIGGSDDQSGLFCGRAWTETPNAASVGEFLENIRAGRCIPRGSSGGPLTVAHGLYNKIRVFLGEHFEPVKNSKLARNALARFMEGRDPTRLTWREKWDLAVAGVLSGKIFELLKPANASLWDALSKALDSERPRSTSGQIGESEIEHRAFRTANSLAGRLSFEFFRSFAEQARKGDLLGAVRDLAVLLPVLASLTPYVFEIRRESPNRELMRSAFRALYNREPEELGKRKIAWFTDTLEDVNGVSRTICHMASEGVALGYDVLVLSCRADSKLDGVPHKNFAPVGEFAIPEYELQRLAFPPLLDVVYYIHQQSFTEVVISTPGPMGLVGLLAARLLNLPVRGIYHTDFPRYVGILTEDSAMESLTWVFMEWFYSQLDQILVNSEPYRQSWIARGVSPSLVGILPRGVDSDFFSPDKRDPSFWMDRGVAENESVLLYVGRVSKEKGLHLLGDVSDLLESEKVRLAVVGDGPFLDEMKRLMPRAIFTGYLSGETLAAAYASADVFLFPSETDTYGNVVVEAMASGLPCVVADRGGQVGLVQHGISGLLCRAGDAADFARALRRLCSDKVQRSTMARYARRSVADRSWKSAAEVFFRDGFAPEASEGVFKDL